MATRLPNGKYRAQVYIGTDESGKRLYKSFVEETADEAEYAALTYKLGKGKRTDAKAVTLRAAMDAYIQSKEGVLSPATVQSYKSIAANFGEYVNTPLPCVNTINLQRAMTEYATRRKMVKHNGTGKVSAKSARNAYGFINAVLRQNGIHIDGIKLPQKERISYNTPFGADLAAIFRAVEGSTLEVPCLLAAWCSLRRSEILGLQYRDIDRETKTIKISRARVYVGAKDYIKGTKNETSTRTVFLPDYILGKIDAARGDKKDDDFIVTIKGGSITKCFNDRLRAAGLPLCRFHDLRHAFVSILKANGVDDKYIQEMGGWANNSVMNAVYAQTSTEVKKQISQTVDAVFLGIVQHNAT